MKQWTVIIALLLICVAQTAFAAVVKVVIKTRPDAWGQKLEEIHLLADGFGRDRLRASDFTLRASARYTNESWQVKPQDIRITEDEIVLDFKNFPTAWYDVGSFRCTCRNLFFAFAKDDVTRTETAVADDFEKHSIYREDWSPTGETFDYSLFTPEGTGPFPLVLVLHGRGDWDILYSGCEATIWAEPDNQAEHPAYVLVPYFDEGTTISSPEVLEYTLAKIHEMIDAGQVDPTRVYIMGHSMGGYHGVLLLTRYSEQPLFAGALLLTPWVDRTLSEEEILRAKDTPTYVIYGEKDPYIPNPGEIYDLLQVMGSETIYKTVYPKEEFDKRGIDSQHLVDLIMFEDDTYVNWLFEQHLELE